MRLTTKRCPTTSCTRPETDPDSSSLESALHSFLSTVPEGVSRCRRSRLARVAESPAAPVSEMAKPQQEGPEEKQAELQSEARSLEAKQEVEKTREIAHCVLSQQTSKSSLAEEDVVLSTPSTPATPGTPRPRASNYFFTQNGEFGSPWTILSPLTCSERNSWQRNRQKVKRSLSTGGDEPHDGVWKSDLYSQAPGQTPSPARLPGHPGKESITRLLDFRSVSVDGSRPSPTSRFRLGQWFHRGTPRRSFSLTEKGICPVEGSNQLEAASGLFSFFRRIGGKTKPSSVKDQNYRGSRT